MDRVEATISAGAARYPNAGDRILAEEFRVAARDRQLASRHRSLSFLVLPPLDLPLLGVNTSPNRIGCKPDCDPNPAPESASPFFVLRPRGIGGSRLEWENRTPSDATWRSSWSGEESSRFRVCGNELDAGRTSWSRALSKGLGTIDTFVANLLGTAEFSLGAVSVPRNASYVRMIRHCDVTDNAVLQMSTLERSVRRLNYHFS